MPFVQLHYFSAALQKQTACWVLLPDTAFEPPYEVMFLLHGLSDDHTIWTRRTSIERYIDGLPLMVVMPDGGRGFYLDAHEGYAYGKAIGEELPDLIRKTFRTKDRWSITGLSMGGYGAFRLGMTYPDTFASAVSHSGALRFAQVDDSVRSPERQTEFLRLLGPNASGGPNDLYALAKGEKLPALRFDCGTEDFLIEDNRAFARYLSDEGIAHEYEEFPGDHNWEYWDTHVREAITFHRKNLSF